MKIDLQYTSGRIHNAVLYRRAFTTQCYKAIAIRVSRGPNPKIISNAGRSWQRTIFRSVGSGPRLRACTTVTIRVASITTSGTSLKETVTGHFCPRPGKKKRDR